MIDTVVIIGAGRLSLGLLFPWAQSAAQKVVLINRAARPDTGRGYRDVLQAEGRYQIMTPAQTHELEHVTLLQYDQTQLAAAAENAALPASLDACVEAISGSAVVLVSVGARNLSAVAHLLALAAVRRAHSPLHVIACENFMGAAASLRAAADAFLPAPLRLLDRIRTHPAIVDRACMDAVLDGRNVRVPIERHGEVILQRDASEFFNGREVAEGLLPIVRLVEEETFPTYMARKLWFVNGTHLALAIECRVNRFATFAEAMAAADTEVFLGGLHAEWTAVFDSLVTDSCREHAALSPPQIKAYAGLMVERVRDLPHFGYLNAMREITDLDPPAPGATAMPAVALLLDKINKRLADPVRLGWKHEVDTPLSAVTLARGIDVLVEHTKRFMS